jgi:large subunit ribosomal protein L23
MIKNPISTEKAIRMLNEENKLVFIVDRKARKPEIKAEIESLFNVKVIKVCTLIDRKGNKKAFVKFSPETPALDLATKLGLM